MFECPKRPRPEISAPPKKQINKKKTAYAEACENPDLAKALRDNVVHVGCFYCGELIPVVLNGTTYSDIPHYAMRASSYLVHISCHKVPTRELPKRN